MKPWILVILLAGCAHDPTIVSKGHGHVDAGATAQLSVGMTKAEVIRRFGTPLSARAHEGVETLHYVEERPWWNWVDISISLTNGAVAAYGDTQYIKTTKQIIEVHQPQ